MGERVSGEHALAAGGTACPALRRVGEEALDESRQLLARLVGDDGAAEALLDAIDVVAEHERAARDGVVDAIRDEPVRSHVRPVVVEDDGG